MRDYMELGSAPCNEDCVSVTRDGDYLPAMRQECLRFIDLIRKKLGPEPEGARLTVQSNPHDFGTYLEVVCYYDDQDEEARRYAYRCESDAPKTWDDHHLSPEEEAREQERKKALDGICRECGEEIEDPEAFVEHVMGHVRAHKARTASPEELVAVLVPRQEPAPALPPGPPVCDSCLTVAYSQGADDRLTASEGMVMLGQDLDDHLCDARESPGMSIKCECACNRKEVRRARSQLR